MVWGLALIVAAALLGGCSVLLTSPTAQCAQAADCAARGFSGAVCSDGMCVASDAGAAADAPADPWSCVGSTVWPEEDTGRRVRSAGQFLALVSNSPLPDIELRVCGAFDVACAAPLATTKTDADGRYDLSVAYGFRGFVEARPAPSSGLLPMLLPFLPPPSQDQGPGEGLPVHDPSNVQLDTLLGTIGKSVDPEAGHVFGAALDCDGRPAAGITLEAPSAPPSSVRYYVDGTGLPGVDQTSTSDNGSVGYVNLAPGPVILRWTRGGKLVGTANVQVRKGTVTVVALPPTPLSGASSP